MFGLRYTCVIQLLCLHVLVCYCDPPITTPMVQLGVTDQQTTSPTTASTAPRVDLIQRRQYMLHMIRQNFMREMRWNTLPTIDASIQVTPPDIERYVQDLTTETQSCYPASCALPNTINSDMWGQDDASMRLFFPVDSFPAGDVRAKNATLSLFARARSECGCSVDDETATVRLLVEVNQFLQAVRPRRRMRRPRMQNLDIGILNWNEEGWMHFNVKDAVQDWMSRPRRMFGLEIKVERLRQFTPGRRITDFDANEVFGQVVCNLPRDIACLDRLPLLRNNDYSPVLEVWTETRPTLGKRKRRSPAVANRQYQKKRAKLIKDFYEES